jgi:hypothetical protein
MSFTQRSPYDIFDFKLTVLRDYEKTRVVTRVLEID